MAVTDWFGFKRPETCKLCGNAEMGKWGILKYSVENPETFEKEYMTMKICEECTDLCEKQASIFDQKDEE